MSIRKHRQSRILAPAAHRLLPPFLIAIAACLSGCGKPPAAATGSQVAARVDGEEISVHQINRQLLATRSADDGRADPATQRAALDRLIDQELAVQAALRDHLDQDPQVMLELDAARRGVLATAHMRRLFAHPVDPSEREVSGYYDAHPELFGKRKIYRLRELTIRGVPDVLHGAAERARSGASLQEIAAALGDPRTDAVLSDSVRPAEQVPLDMLPRLAAAPRGQTLVIEQAGSMRLIRVEEARPDPIGEADALPLIRRYLKNERRIAAIQAETRRLRGAADIEYLGKFGANAPAVPAPSPASGAAIAAADAS